MFATAHPIREGFAGAFVRSTTPKEGAPNPFAAILAIPLEPFRAVGPTQNSKLKTQNYSNRHSSREL